MKPDWDRLADDFASDPSVVIANVDCTDSDGEDVCTKYGVTGYPTLKSFVGGGDPMGETYEGERDFDALKAHAANNLKPQCGDDSEELCDEQEKATLAQYRAMSWRGRKKLLRAAEQKKEQLEADYDAKGAKLQKKQEEIEAAVNKKVNTDILTPELRLLRTIPVS